MINIGDLVRIKGKAINEGGRPEYCIPKGKICRVVSIDEWGFVECVPIDEYSPTGSGYLYRTECVEKGRLCWIPGDNDSDDDDALQFDNIKIVNVKMKDIATVTREEDWAKIVQLIAKRTKEITKYISEQDRLFYLVNKPATSVSKTFVRMLYNTTNVSFYCKRCFSLINYFGRVVYRDDDGKIKSLLWDPEWYGDKLGIYKDIFSTLNDIVTDLPIREPFNYQTLYDNIPYEESNDGNYIILGEDSELMNNTRFNIIFWKEYLNPRFTKSEFENTIEMCIAILNDWNLNDITSVIQKIECGQYSDSDPIYNEKSNLIKMREIAYRYVLTISANSRRAFIFDNCAKIIELDHCPVTIVFSDIDRGLSITEAIDKFNKTFTN